MVKIPKDLPYFSPIRFFYHFLFYVLTIVLMYLITGAARDLDDNEIILFLVTWTIVVIGYSLIFVPLYVYTIRRTGRFILFSKYSRNGNSIAPLGDEPLKYGARPITTNRVLSWILWILILALMFVTLYLPTLYVIEKVLEG